MRSFNIFDFPKDQVYVLLKDNFRVALFGCVIKRLSSLRRLGEYLNISATMILKWKWASNNNKGKKCVQCIPLSALYKIYLLLKENKHFLLNKIQENVIEYKAKRGSSVHNPKLPLIEDERLVRIFFHLAGDGYAGRYGGGKPHYYNIEPNVMKEFIKDLSVFGDVKSRFEENGKKVIFPRVIGHIMKHIYKTDFMSKNTRIPKEFFKLDNKIIAQGIKVFADDEGSVTSSKIKISSSNKLFLNDILNLIKNKFVELGRYIKIEGKDEDYKLIILARGMKIYKDLINFTHYQKKNNLNFYLNIKKKRGNVNETRNRVLLFLSKEPKSVKQLCFEIRVSPNMILKHIQGYTSNKRYVLGLKSLGLIKQIRNKNHKEGYLWCLTKKGIELCNKIKV